MQLLELKRKENARAYEDVGHKLEIQTPTLEHMQAYEVRIQGDVGLLTSAVKKMQVPTDAHHGRLAQLEAAAIMEERRPNRLVKKAVEFMHDVEATHFKEDAHRVTAEFRARSFTRKALTASGASSPGYGDGPQFSSRHLVSPQIPRIWGRQDF